MAKPENLVREARRMYAPDDVGTAHVWTMKRRPRTAAPVCKFCGVTSKAAQIEQPYTRGVGPCVVRMRLTNQPKENT